MSIFTYYNVYLRRFTLLCVVMFVCTLASCNYNDEIPDSNGVMNGLGFNSVELTLPHISKFEGIAEHTFVLINLMGESDREEYILPMMINYSDDEGFTIKSCTKITEKMPHQRYYLNEVLYHKDIVASTVEELEALYNEKKLKSRSLGAIVSMESPDNIYIVSSIDDSWVPGDGTKESPYLISCYESLYAIYRDVAEKMALNTPNYEDYEGEYFMLTNNIDMYRKDDFSLEVIDSWIPIGSPYSHSDATLKHSCFRGTFDGNGFSINNLYSNITGNTSYGVNAGTLPEDEIDLGLFYSLGSGAVVKNLSFISTIFMGDSNIGTVAAMTESGATDIKISNIYASGIIAGKDNMGSIVGKGGGITFEGCISDMNISNNPKYSVIDGKTVLRQNVGGVIGYATGGEVSLTDCSFRGSITYVGLDNVGGLIGRADADIVFNEKCAVAGVIGAALDVGGIIGLVQDIEGGSTVKITINDVLYVGGTYIASNDGSSRYHKMNCAINNYFNFSFDYSYVESNNNIYYNHWYYYVHQGFSIDEDMGGVGGAFGACVNAEFDFREKGCISINKLTTISNEAWNDSDYGIVFGGVCGFMENCKIGSFTVSPFEPKINVYQYYNDYGLGCIFGVAFNLIYSESLACNESIPTVYVGDDFIGDYDMVYPFAGVLTTSVPTSSEYFCMKVDGYSNILNWIKDYNWDNPVDNMENDGTIEYIDYINYDDKMDTFIIDNSGHHH